MKRTSSLGRRNTPPQPLAKLATGIEGFDELSRGGVPLNRTSLLVGGPGAGKTVFALQCLTNAVRRHRAFGIFVAFEESPCQIIANGANRAAIYGQFAAPLDGGVPLMKDRQLVGGSLRRCNPSRLPINRNHQSLSSYIPLAWQVADVG